MTWEKAHPVMTHFNGLVAKTTVNGTEYGLFREKVGHVPAHRRWAIRQRTNRASSWSFPLCGFGSRKKAEAWVEANVKPRVE